ncbi:MAG: DUF1501 domain-containing protein [Planctomycetaceae bacterium]
MLGNDHQRPLDFSGMTRRGMLQVGALGGLGLSLPSFLAQQKLLGATPADDVNCILVWTLGGTSHHDTFDPKPEAPAAIRGEYSTIDTAVPGVKFTEVAPRMAQELNRFALLRGWNPENGSHGFADHWVMSGHRPNPSLVYPTYGSVIAHEKGFKNALPPFVQLGSSVDHSFNGGEAGILGLPYNPFEMLADPNGANFSVRDITPPAGINMDRVNRRRGMLSALNQLQVNMDRQPEAFSSLDQHFQTALKMITAPETKLAFEIDREDPKLRDRYGRNYFGQRCLLARRLIESGVRFVTVSDPGWDTHANNFASLKSGLMPRVDQGLSTLLTDLDERGLLDTTLVLWLTDFGRTPNINSASGRDHWATAGFAVMAGAGIPGGSVLGATDDEGGRPVRDEYISADIAATVYEKLGIPNDLVVSAPDGRPIKLIDGKVIKEWV